MGKKSKNQRTNGTYEPVNGQNINISQNNIMSRSEDETLIAQCQSGQMAAFGELAEKYQHRLYNALHRILGNPDDALELTQEAFFRSMQSISKFRGKSSFYTWLYRIGVNLALNHRQRQQKIQFNSYQHDAEMTGTQADGLAALMDSGDETPHYHAELKEQHQLVLSALEKLDMNARAIVILRDIEQLSYAEIAEILDIETGTVKSRLSRARMALRNDILAKEQRTE